jgi:hypothetical protein
MDLRPGLLLAFLARFYDGIMQDKMFRLANLSYLFLTKNYIEEL